ncbi:MAG: hypothetical protein IT355_06820 [Gemmatimonadaceae bacterium]|nr:hypothetical protein [Gemmatimonadaceae bacterium]
MIRSEDVVELYQHLDRLGVAIWIDGGWAVDAVVGRQTRAHDDLDIAVEATSLAALRRFLEQRSFRDVPTDDASPWNFVLADPEGRRIDVHAVVLSERDGVWGDPLDGIAYPAGSLTGRGDIAGTSVRCVCADALLRFKTSYPPRPIDREDVAELCALLDRPVPETHSLGGSGVGE